MEPATVLIVGGFLGAGKTSLLRCAAARLSARGVRAGLVTNDQAPDLVDTGLLEASKLAVREVAGSCFCCNFPSFERSLDELAAACGGGAPVSLLAEPVGSCTDLAATVLRPLRAGCGGVASADRFRTAPLSVLVDVQRLARELSESAELHPDARYILFTQLDEADIIIVSKADLLDSAARAKARDLIEMVAPGREIRFISVVTGEGVEEWLDACLTARVPGGQRRLEVDYDRYANGEAVLGWMNCVVTLRRGDAAPSWKDLSRQLLEQVAIECSTARVAIAHVKSWLGFESGWVAGNLAGAGGPLVRSEGASDCAQGRMTINARVQMQPRELVALMHRSLSSLRPREVVHEMGAVHALSPGRPVPTYRLGR